ncbi:MAG TPA: PAS domain S-box protein [Baekduia sp.]|nr:PAS domain S-box protein [Baekduia sp.]
MDEAGPVGEVASSRRAHELALLVDSVRDYAILLLDDSGTIMTWNIGAERLKGYTAEEAVGRHFSLFHTDEDRARDHPAEVLAAARRDGRYEEEGWRVRRDGSRFWASIVMTAIQEPDGTSIGFGKVVHDLTTRRLAEERLRETADELAAANMDLEQFRRLVLGVRDYAIFLLDPAGYVITWNAGAENAKGYTAEEIIGRHFSVFYASEDQARDHPGEELRIAAETGRYEEEGWRIRKDGTRFWASVVLTAVRDDAGTLLGFAKVTRDLTERRASEQAIRDANTRLERTNRELDRFAAVAAHDLQEPLRTIAGFSGLLAERHAGGLDETGHSYLAHIASGVERMTRLVDDLLGYARAAEPSGIGGDTVVLADAVAAVLAELEATVREHGADVTVAVPPDAHVHAEARDVEAALRNLISNAVKFADGDGPRVEIRAKIVDRDVRIDVIDNGIGIDPAERPRLFQPFQRLSRSADQPGTGLGLAIAQRVVERNGGAIGVDSTAGEGSRFWFTLPAA